MGLLFFRFRVGLGLGKDHVYVSKTQNVNAMLSVSWAEFRKVNRKRVLSLKRKLE